MEATEQKPKKKGWFFRMLIDVIATVAVHVEERKKEKQQQQERKPDESAYEM